MMRNTRFSLREQTLRQKLRFWTSFPLPNPCGITPKWGFSETAAPFHSCRFAPGRAAPFLFGKEDEERKMTFAECRRGLGTRSPHLLACKSLFDFVILSMATNFLSTGTGQSGKGAGSRHVAYISGLDKYSDKDEVLKVIDKNIPPSVAKDGVDFFQKADLMERANGRSYRRLIIAIPREATDKTAWAQGLVDDILKDKHPYRLAIHDKGDGNPHAHLMFSERGLAVCKTPKDFFCRKNPKDRTFSEKQWLVDTKALYLSHVKLVCPDFKPKMSGEPKIGPKLKFAGKSYETNRVEREKVVHLIRRGEAAMEKFAVRVDTAHAKYVATLKPSLQKIAQKMHIISKVMKPRKDGLPHTTEEILKELSRQMDAWLQSEASISKIRQQTAELKYQELQMRIDELMSYNRMKEAPRPFTFSPSSTIGRADKPSPTVPTRTRFKR